MTSSRIVRGTKGRIILYVCGVLIITGIIACYNNTRLQLEDVQKSNELCHQQQEHLNSQLQGCFSYNLHQNCKSTFLKKTNISFLVIFDYKQRLEKSLKSEQAEHQQIKSDLESQLKKENEENEKIISENKQNKLRIASLQNQHSLLEVLIVNLSKIINNFLPCLERL